MVNLTSLQGQLELPRQMLDPLTEVLRVASLLLSLATADSPLCLERTYRKE